MASAAASASAAAGSAAPEYLQRARGVAEPLRVVGEQQMAVVTALRNVDDHMPVYMDQLEKLSGVKLEGNTELLELLQANPKVDCSGGKFAYVAIHRLSGKQAMLDLIGKVPDGVPVDDLVHSYRHAKRDIEACIEAAQVICVKCSGSHSDVLFARTSPLLSPLTGTVSVKKNGKFLTTSHDLREEVRRNDIIVIDGHHCRVSARTKKRDGRQVETSTMQVTGGFYSASSTIDHRIHDKDSYLEEFNETTVPLFGKYTGPTVEGVKAYKYGFPNDVRSLWQDVINARDWPSDPNMLIEQMKLKGIGTKGKRQKFSQHKAQKKRKRARRRNATGSKQLGHLEGTALGAEIAKQLARLR